MFPFHYFRYKLYESGRSRTRQDIIDYVPEFYYDRILLPVENDSLTRSVLRSKILSAKLLDGIGIPQPRTLFWCENGRVMDSECRTMTQEKFEAILKGCRHPVFLKPSDGAGGAGIRVFEVLQAGEFEDASGVVLDYGFVESLAKQGDFIAQEGLEQVDDLAELFPHSINSLRIATVVRDNCTMPVVAILRMGRRKNRVDNSAQGGISVAVDLDNWQLATVGHSEHPVDDYAEHPDTGVPFGRKLPMKNEVLDLIQRAAPMFAKCNILGWDIALTPDGPFMIEINGGFGIDHVQITSDRGVREDLGIVEAYPSKQSKP